jgi:hypothetical protein
MLEPLPSHGIPDIHSQAEQSLMKRRSFIQASVTGLSIAAAEHLAAQTAGNPPGRDLYELRTYTLKSARLNLLENYLSQAFIPALKRFGVGPVGVFVEQGEAQNRKVHVLIVHPTAEGVATLSTRLFADPVHQSAAADYLAASSSDPVYERIETSLLLAIEGLPKLARPDPKKPRLFNLRTYESHNERASRKKIEMFNRGELAIFQRVGLTPVFFAETLVGSAMPNLTYLLVFPDDAGLKEAWGKFRADPEWLKLRAIPEYADKEIVSRITNRVLTPAAYSEI